jgi:ribose/xylose/arabinose/galactoside ABC-type transport system permease subunit
MRRLLRFLARYGIFAALVIECLVLAVTTDSFLRFENLMNVLRQNSFTAILAAGMTFAILTAGIDLSVGSVVGLAGVLCADVLAKGGPVGAGIAVALLVGMAVGATNGLVVTWIKIPPFLVTLAMMLIVRGVARKYTGARPISGLPASFSALSAGLTPALIMLAVFALAWVALVRTPFGRHVYAVGGNPEAAWLSGIRVERTLVWVYLLCGLAAGMTGALMASRLDAGHPEAGMLYELDAVAAVVVGGGSLFGGRGSVWGTLAGAFFIGILNNGLNLHNVGGYEQQIVKGLVLLLAASLDLWRSPGNR